MARGITGQGSKSHPVPEERVSVQWGLVGTTVGRSIRVEGQMGIPDFLHYRHQEPRSCPGKGNHGGWGAPGSVWFLATDSASVLKSWNFSNSSLSDCLNGASHSEAKHRWCPSAQVILSVLSGPQKSVTGSMRTRRKTQAGAQSIVQLTWPRCSCATGTQAFGSAIVLSWVGFLE